MSLIIIPTPANNVAHRHVFAQDGASLQSAVAAAIADLLAAHPNGDVLGLEFGAGAAGTQYVAHILASKTSEGGVPLTDITSIRIVEATDVQSLTAAWERALVAEGTNLLAGIEAGIGGAGGNFVFGGLFITPGGG